VKKFIILMFFCILIAPSWASGKLNVAATVPNMGMLAREIGGNKVNVTVMTPPDRDAHYLEARPSMMAALRRADLVAAVGAELEIGWLPAAIRGANNPRVQTGRTGYFEGAAHIELIETGQAADRSKGDVHPAGNPHFDLDPVKLAKVGHALAQRMASMDTENASYYRQNALEFESKVEERIDRWMEEASADGVLPYHGDANYLFRRLGIPIYDTIEVLPGIPPTASHLRSLVRDLRGKEGIITYIIFQPSRGPEFMSGQLGWPVHRLPAQVPVEAEAKGYFEMIDRWVEALSGN